MSSLPPWCGRTPVGLYSVRHAGIKKADRAIAKALRHPRDAAGTRSLRVGDVGERSLLVAGQTAGGGVRCGMAEGVPLESNGLRVLTRVGWGRVHLKNYGAMYKSVQEAIAAEVPKGAEALARTHVLLRTHGKKLCKDARPQCFECPAEEMC